jgi:hypothetical protein
MRLPPPPLLLALAASCTSQDLPPPVVSAVDPPAVPNASSSAVTVLGRNFAAEVTVDFDDPGQSQVDAVFDLTIVHPNGRRFLLEDVTLVSSTEILATVPAGLSPQTYDLLLVDPRGGAAVLPDALQIYQGDCTKDDNLCASGNPCTINDYCQGHRCVGTAVADGTPCQLVCTVPVETCQAGACTLPPGGCPP